MNKYFKVRKSCPACKAENNILHLKLGYNDAKMKEYLNSMYSNFHIEYEYLENNLYILNECIDCGLIYQKETPNEFLIQKIYNEWIDIKTVYDVDEKKKKIDEYIWPARNIINVIRYLDAIPSEINILDFGMGLGTWCQLARGFGGNVYGIDISEERMDYVKASGIKVIKFEDIPNYEFDFIHSDQVFEHINEPLEILIYLSKALKQNGIINISVPNGQDIKRRLEIWNLENTKTSENSSNPFTGESENTLKPVSPFEHINCFNHDALIKMAKNAGLIPVVIPNQLVNVSNVPGLRQILKRHIKGILKRYGSLLVRRKNKKGIKSTNLFFIDILIYQY